MLHTITCKLCIDPRVLVKTNKLDESMTFMSDSTDTDNDDEDPWHHNVDVKVSEFRRLDLEGERKQMFFEMFYYFNAVQRMIFLVEMCWMYHLCRVCDAVTWVRNCKR